MKTFYLSEHSTYCHNPYCDAMPEEFIFFMANRFIHLKVHGCLWGRIDDKLDLVKRITKNSNLYSIYDVDKKYDIERVLHKCIDTGEFINRSIFTINYLYQSSRYEISAICTTSNVVEEFMNNDVIEQNYHDAKQWLIDNKKDYLIDSLEKLYYHNTIRIDDSCAVQTVDKLIKVIKKQIK